VSAVTKNDIMPDFVGWPMCLGIPALVLERQGEIGKVDFGGTMREVNLSLVDARAGEYVIVHAGFAIQIIGEKDALETLELFKELYGPDDPDA
jgi:hydrogenase expression/formation protein HypC